MCQLQLNDPQRGLVESEGKIFKVSPEKENIVLSKVHKCLEVIAGEEVDLFSFPEYSFSKNIDRGVSKWSRNRDNIIIGGSYINEGKKNVCPVYIDGRVFYTEKIFRSPLQKDTSKDKMEIKCGIVMWHFDTR